MKDFFAVLGTIVMVIGITVGLTFGGYYSYKYFAPRYEQVRYDTFKQSQTYNDGMLRDLQELKREYEKGDTDTKQLMKAMVLHRFEVYDINRLPYELQVFYRNLDK